MSSFRKPSPIVWRARIGYYVGLVLLALIVHLPLAVSIFGPEATEWLRKANEAYLLAFAVPSFWDAIAFRRSDADLIVRTEGEWRRSRLLWYALLVGGLGILEGPLFEIVFGFRLPQLLITIRDAWLGILILSLYFEWSRGFHRLSSDSPSPSALPLRSGGMRLLYYLVLALGNAAVFQAPVKELLGPDLFSTIDFHAEAFSSALLLPVYFDVIIPLTGGDPRSGTPACPRRRRIVLGAWLAINAVGFWLAQGTITEILPGGLGVWWLRSSEAPLAALIITIYFEWIRPRDGLIQIRNESVDASCAQ